MHNLAEPDAQDLVTHIQASPYPGGGTGAHSSDSAVAEPGMLPEAAAGEMPLESKAAPKGLSSAHRDFAKRNRQCKRE